MKYVVFTDESRVNASRFRSLSAFSMHKMAWNEAKNEMLNILKNSNISEFKWHKLKSGKYYLCAEKIVNFVFDYFEKYKIRLDVIVWDTYDSRHNIKNRDDMANYERMFYHLLNISMKKRPKLAKWDIIVDERNGIDWKTISDCLKAKGKQQESKKNLFGYYLSDPHYYINSFQTECSKKEPLIQIADLFAGLVLFSKNSYTKYELWEQENIPSLFMNKSTSFSNKEKEGFKLLKFFNKKCKEGKYGVSLKSKKCLYTHNSKNNINFWHYKPQHENDKAPIKKHIQ